MESLFVISEKGFQDNRLSYDSRVVLTSARKNDHVAVNSAYNKIIFRKRLLHSFKLMSDFPNYIYNEFCMVYSITKKKLAEEFYMVSSITKKQSILT